MDSKTKRRILIVDDILPLIGGLRRLFQAYGLPIDDTDNPDAAFALVKSDPTSAWCILCDYGLNISTGARLNDGLELIRALRAELPQIKIYFALYSARLEEIREFYLKEEDQHIIDAFLEKGPPVRWDEFLKPFLEG